MDPERTEKLNPNLRFVWKAIDNEWSAYFADDPQRTASGKTREEAAGRLLMFVPEQGGEDALLHEVVALREIVIKYANFTYKNWPVNDPIRIKIEQGISKANPRLWLEIQQNRPGKQERVLSDENGDE